MHLRPTLAIDKLLEAPHTQIREVIQRCLLHCHAACRFLRHHCKKRTCQLRVTPLRRAEELFLKAYLQRSTEVTADARPPFALQVVNKAAAPLLCLDELSQLSGNVRMVLCHRLRRTMGRVPLQE
ncbi:hypothetical protein DQ04_00651000 [Trypanosoma grayi]|uniref:hypothetical protein n=1 Tax=Trypanosoma grayi TaxID=71804 RepID=UPI0004F41918|nr:hypothetical protein DQ04_00651000 [Trypanosoma grayi]KEG14046.1 hypothetical protein DQ04_00651000 [Trypanosoma grayi]